MIVLVLAPLLLMATLMLGAVLEDRVLGPRRATSDASTAVVPGRPV